MDRKVSVDLEKMLDYLKYIFMVLVAWVHGIPELTWFLLSLMVLDAFFGLAVAIRTRTLSPTAAWKAATRKLGSLGIIVMAAIVDKYVNLLGMDLVQISTVFYIGPEVLSILRNAAILEIPVPPQFANVLRVFQEKNDNANKDLP